jgi:hypothetical protein
MNIPNVGDTVLIEYPYDRIYAHISSFKAYVVNVARHEFKGNSYLITYVVDGVQCMCDVEFIKEIYPTEAGQVSFAEQVGNGRIGE